MKNALLILSVFLTSNVYSQSDTTRTGERVFQLEEVRVTGVKNLESINVISSPEMEKLNQVDVSGALNRRKQAAKRNPPYQDTDPEFKVRFGQWPKWDKESLYLLSNSSLGSHYQLKTRWYRDTFVNELVSYDDTTYTSSTTQRS